MAETVTDSLKNMRTYTWVMKRLERLILQESLFLTSLKAALSDWSEIHAKPFLEVGMRKVDATERGKHT